LAQGGTEQSILELIKNFSDETEVFVIYFYSKHDLLEAFKEATANVIFLNLNGRYDWIKGYQKLKQTLKQIKPDLVIASLYRSNIISRFACLSLGIKTIGTFVEDNYGEERKKTFRGIKGLLKFYPTYLLDRATSFIPCAWISNSKSIGKNHIRYLGISEHKVYVIYRGRDSREIMEWKIPVQNTFVFVTIGRLYEKKGFKELISAFSLLEKKYPEISLIIYGEGPQRNELEKQITDLQLEHKIILPGNTPKAYTKLYQANCFVFPSRFEGFSGSLVEAMMSGIPIICSNISMNIEAVDHEETALVHSINDVDDLYNKMCIMIEKYPKMIEMGKRAREKALNYFEIRNISKQYEQLLYKINAKK
jgi:glycosyltransferase involved in cell wall biosynthesis